MTDDKDTAGNLADAARNKLNEGADRARAAGHEVASNASDNPVDQVTEKAKATGNRLKAEVHNAEAHADADAATRD